MSNYISKKYLYTISCDKDFWYLTECTLPQIINWIERLNKTDNGYWTFQEVSISPYSVIECRVNRLELQAYDRDQFK